MTCNCGNGLFSSGKCVTCYYKYRAEVNGPCKIEGCHRGAELGKLMICKAHYYQTHNQRSKDLMRKYGITQEVYDEMFAKQKGLCAICLGGPTDIGKKNDRLSVDHDHKTGKVRGLLCNDCNVSLGKFKDDISILKRAIKYLNG